MGRWRWVTGVGVVAVLAGAAIFLSLQDGEESTVTTTTAILTTTSQDEITTTEATTTSTTTAEQRQAEVEQLLKDLWFGWFDAIYRKDPEALWQVVATTRSYEAGVAAMETMKFTAEPTQEAILLHADVLLDRSDCLVVFQAIDTSAFRGPVGLFDTVSVTWPDDRYGFRFATDWALPGDLWLQDCDNLEREQTP